MGLSDVPKSGRELAIEALIDLEEGGPSYRVGRILVRFADIGKGLCDLF
jgi:hypothetical protein